MTRETPLERWALIQDLGVVVASLLIAKALKEKLAILLPGLAPTVATGQYLHLLLVFLPTWALGADRVGLHRVRTLTGPVIDLLRTVLWAQAFGAAAIAIILVAAQVNLNRSLIAVFLVTSTVLLLIAKAAQRRWILGQHGQLRALLIGGVEGQPVRDLELLRGTIVEVLPSTDAAGLRSRLQDGSVDEVLLSPSVPRDQVRALLETCELVGIPALVPLEEVDLALVPPRAEVVGRTLYLTYEPHGRDRPTLIMKAILDYLLATVLFVVSLPLLLATALLVRLTTPGPALFIQPRGGLNGHPFPMLKFRTMRVGTEAERQALLASNEMDGPVFKMSDDPRVTPIGGFLRQTSLDELPQLVNVLLGHMSLVGPRPLPLVETRGLSGVHRRRMSMKPGITGLSQVSGRSDLRFQEWMALDIKYIDTWSLGLDFAILLRTIPALLSRRGAR